MALTTFSGALSYIYLTDLTQNTPYQEHRAPLTTDDRRGLKMGFVLIGIFTIFVVGIFSFAFALVVDMERGWNNWPVYITAAFAAVFATVIIVQTYRVIHDLIVGEQVVLTGRVTEKSEYVSMKSRGRSSRLPKYYLHFGEKKMEVKLNHYSQTSGQDLVELRYAHHSKNVFSIETIESGLEKVEETKQRWSSRHKERDTGVDTPLTPEDRGLLKKTRNRAIFYRVVVLLVSGWFFIGFALSELWGLVLLMSPTVVVFIYQAYRLVKTLSLYREDIETGYKIGLTVQITDKKMKHGRHHHHILSCGKRSLTVDQAIFDTVSVGNRVTEYSGKCSGNRINVVPSNQ
jgi:hypothetical protein